MAGLHINDGQICMDEWLQCFHASNDRPRSGRRACATRSGANMNIILVINQEIGLVPHQFWQFMIMKHVFQNLIMELLNQACPNCSLVTIIFVSSSMMERGRIATLFPRLTAFRESFTLRIPPPCSSQLL